MVNRRRGTGGRRAVARQNRTWSNEETKSVIRFMREYNGRNYSRRLIEIFPGKSSKQIRDKVALLCQNGVIPTAAGPAVAVEDVADSEEDNLNGGDGNDPPFV